MFNTSEKNKYSIKFEYLAFLKQSNVIKHVYFDHKTKATKVIFAYCDQDIRNKGKMTLMGHVFSHNSIENAHEEGMKFFLREFPIDPRKQVADAKRISRKIDKLMSRNEEIFIEQQPLLDYQRNYEELNIIEKSQREEIYKYSGMVSVKFGKRWAIIKES